MGSSVHNYLAKNRRLARLLVDCRLAEVIRLLDSPLDDGEDIRFVNSPAMLVSDAGMRWLVDAEESKANILLIDLTEASAGSGPWYSGFTIRQPIVGSSPTHPIHFLLAETVRAVERISRDPEPGVLESFFMCGLRLTMDGGHRVCIGTCLTESRHQEVAFRLPDEVDPGLRYDPL